MSLLKKIDAIRFGKTEMQMRWKARLWAARKPQRVPSASPVVIFAVPLVSKRRAKDWDVVCRNLTTTLTSILRQSDSSFRVYICGQDRPVLPEDSRVEFVPANVSDKFYDKGDKRRILIQHISRTLKADGYYMQLDADDVLHPNFVGHIVTDHNARGYYVESGYFLSLTANGMAPISSFHKHCGSSAAVYVDFRQDRHDVKLLNEMRSHTKVVEISEQYGQPLAAMPFAACLYVTGHGENMVARRGKLDARTQNFLLREIGAEDRLRVLKEFEVEEEFALSMSQVE